MHCFISGRDAFCARHNRHMESWPGNNTIKSISTEILYTSLTTILGFMQDNTNRFTREDSSASDDNGDSQSQSTVFILGGDYQMPSTTAQYTSMTNVSASNAISTASSLATSQSLNNTIVTAVAANATNSFSNLTSAHSASAILIPQGPFERLVCPDLSRFFRHFFWFFFFWNRSRCCPSINTLPPSAPQKMLYKPCLAEFNCISFFFSFLFSPLLFFLPGPLFSPAEHTRLLSYTLFPSLAANRCSNTMASVKEETRQSTISLNQDQVAPLPRNKKTAYVGSNRATPMPPPRRATSQQRFVLLNVCVRVCPGYSPFIRFPGAIVVLKSMREMYFVVNNTAINGYGLYQLVGSSINRDRMAYVVWAALLLEPPSKCPPNWAIWHTNWNWFFWCDHFDGHL